MSFMSSLVKKINKNKFVFQVLLGLILIQKPNKLKNNLLPRLNLKHQTNYKD